MMTAFLAGLVLLSGEPAPSLQLQSAPAPESFAAIRFSEPQDEAAWREALNDPDLARREEVYGNLLQLAQRDRETRDMLQTWAKEDGDLGWTGRLALRELELRESPLARRFNGLQGLPGFGGRQRGGLGGIWDLDPWSDPMDTPRWFRDPFWMRDFEQGLGALLDQAQPGSSQSESFRMESGPDGVRVEVTEQQGDETSTTTYEADSIEELYELHPELRGKVSIGTAPPGWDSGFRDLLDGFRARRGFVPGLSGAIPTDKLGVMMREPGNWSASVEGLEPGTGLFVERVFPGTLADALGVRPGDILVSLDGRPLRSGDDVLAALSERGHSDRVVLEVFDSRGELRELTWRPPYRE